MTKTCSRCGATLKKNAKFCTVCGNPTTAAGKRQTLVSPEKRQGKCPNCGKAIKGSEKFCTGCGTSLTQITPTPPVLEVGNVCPHCGWNKNPAGSNYCINCGQGLPSATRQPEASVSESAKEFPSPAPTLEVASVQPITVPVDVLASLMARGRQLMLEEEYVKNGAESDELLAELSQAAGDSDFELEELIDTFINERAEVERLETLYEKGEVSGRVYARLKKEYDEKLEKIDAQIQDGVVQLQGYQAQIQVDLATAKEELDTIDARIRIGDEDITVEDKKPKLTEKTTRLNYAHIATKHILQKESTMRNGPISRFEVTETTLADSPVVTSISEKHDESDESKGASPEPELPTTDSELPPSQPDAEAGKICTQCGRVTASEAQFCIHCGASL